MQHSAHHHMSSESTHALEAPAQLSTAQHHTARRKLLAAEAMLAAFISNSLLCIVYICPLTPKHSVTLHGKDKQHATLCSTSHDEA
jgi:hypothetical protein